jgi:ABC-2 type transport system permease protein
VNPRVSAVEQIARTELRRYVQDRVAIFTLVLMPLLIVFLIGSAYGSASTVFVVGVVDADDTDSSADLVAALEASNTVATRDYSDEADLRRDIRLGDVAGGLLIPAGYGRDVAAGSAVALPVVTLQADQGSTAVVAAVTGALAGEGAVLAAARFVAGDGSVDPESAVQVARAVAPSVDLPEIDVQTVGTIRPEDENAFTRAVFSQLVLFVFVNGMVAAWALVQTRQLGIGRRAMAAPIGAGAFVSGVAGSRVALGLLQSALLLVAGVLVFGVTWGSWPAIALLVLVWAVVSAGAGMLLGALARTPEQAIAIAVPASIALAMLGGTMWSLEFVGPVMRVIGHLTPHAWAMDAWTAIVNDGAGVTGIATELAVLTAIAVVLMAVSARALRRTLTHGG